MNIRRWSLLGAALPIVAIAPAMTPLPALASNKTVNVSGSLTGMTTSPLTLTPDFSQSINDYAVWCQAGSNTITLHFTGVTPTSATVTVTENQAIVVQATSGTSTTQYWIRCLPHDFPHLAVNRPGNPPAGWYLTGNVNSPQTAGSSLYAMVLDNHGTPVWYQLAPKGSINVELLPNNTIAWMALNGPGVGADPTVGYYLYRLDTQTASYVIAPVLPTDPHELLQLPNGHRMVISTPVRSGMNLGPLGPNFDTANGRIIDCVVQEMDSHGALVWRWNASDHVGINEFNVGYSPAPVKAQNDQLAADLYHCNSVDVDVDASSPTSGDVLVSMRHTDAVYLIDRTTKKVTWRLGGDPANPNKDGATLLTILNDDEVRPYAQHDARFQSNGHVSLYDDHTGQAGAARGVEYAIDMSATPATATLNWQYKSPSGTYANATGSFRRYANGTDNLVGWGFKGGQMFDEVDEKGNLLFNMSFPNKEMEYRAVKVPTSAIDINLMRKTAGLPPAAVTSWKSLGGSLTSGPGATSWGSTRRDVFGRGTDGRLWHKSWNGTSWSGWEALGGQIAPGTGPAAVSWGVGRLDVFVQGVDHGLYHKWHDAAGWHGFEPLLGTLTSSPAAASWAPGRIDVVVVGTDGAFWHRSYSGGLWQGWDRIGGQVKNDPAAASWGTNRLDIFGRGSDDQVWHAFWAGSGWSGFDALGGAPDTGVGATSSSAGQIDIVITSSAHVPQRLEFKGGSWQSWQSLDGATSFTPAISDRGTGKEDVFVTGSNNAAWYTPLTP